MAWLKKGKEIGIDPRSFGLVVEAVGISRVFEHMTEESFGILSASRYTLSAEENMKRTKHLKEEIREMGYGFIPANGVWEGSSEASVFIPLISLKDIQKLSAMFDQDTFIWGDNGEYREIETVGGHVRQTGKSKERFHFLGKGDDADEAQAFTEMKGNRWTLAPETKESLTPQEVHAFRVGGFSTKGNKWTLTNKIDMGRQGQAFFFLHGFDSGKFNSPRFGIAVHDLKDVVQLHYDDSGSTMPLSGLDAYLPLLKSY